MSKNILAAVVFLASFLGVNIASADVYKCNFSSWKGAHNQAQDIAISWTGTGFIADTKRGAVRRVWGNKIGDWVKVSMQKNSKFLTLSVTEIAKDANGKDEHIKRSFRVYETGKCTGYVDFEIYTPMMAQGRLE